MNPIAKTSRKALTTGTIARYCAVNLKTVLKWIHSGALRAYQLPGGTNRVLVADFIAFLSSYHMPVPEELQPPAVKKILIVEDEPHLVQSLRRVFERQGFCVASACDGFEVGHMLAQFQPDVVVLDIYIPGLNGIQVLRKIRSTPETRATHVIVLSGNIDEKIHIELFDLGVEAVLEKPLNTERILTIVTQVCEKKEY